MRDICCCNASQIEAFVVIGLAALTTGLLWHSIILSPLKLIAVFLHEFSHASAAILTCGRVTGIEVNENFGGVTYSRGGSRWITLSAGYTGSVFWGSFFILMTWDKLATRIAAVVFMVAAVATTLILKIKDKKLCGTRCAFGMTMRLIILLVGAVPAALWGQSDAVMFAKEIGGTARMWGFIWSTIALCAVSSALFGLIVLSGKCQP